MIYDRHDTHTEINCLITVIKYDYTFLMYVYSGRHLVILLSLQFINSGFKPDNVFHNIQSQTNINLIKYFIYKNYSLQISTSSSSSSLLQVYIILRII